MTLSSVIVVHYQVIVIPVHFNFVQNIGLAVLYASEKKSGHDGNGAKMVVVHAVRE